MTTTEPLAAATVQCFTPVRGRRMRLTKVDICGRPQPSEAGGCSVVVTKGFVTATLSPEIDEGDEIEVKNASGEICVSVPPCPTLKWTNAEIEFCEVNPALATMINPNWRNLLNHSGAISGFAATRAFSCEGGFALEIWTDVQGAEGTCDDPQAHGAWGYFLIPWMANGALTGDLAIANDAISFTWSAKSKIGSHWGNGPYPVMMGATGQAGPLIAPVLPDEDYRIMVVDVEPPPAMCGCANLVLTAQVGVAGTPGYFTPQGAPPPANLSAMTGITASPATAWTTGQYIVIGGAAEASWNGTAWVTGRRP